MGKLVLGVVTLALSAGTASAADLAAPGYGYGAPAYTPPAYGYAAPMVAPGQAGTTIVIVTPAPARDGRLLRSASGSAGADL
jgi:hypothetical protein